MKEAQTIYVEFFTPSTFRAHILLSAIYKIPANVFFNIIFLGGRVFGGLLSM